MHTHTHLTAFFPGLFRVFSYFRVKALEGNTDELQRVIIACLEVP